MARKAKEARLPRLTEADMKLLERCIYEMIGTIEDHKMALINCGMANPILNENAEIHKKKFYDLAKRLTASHSDQEPIDDDIIIDELMGRGEYKISESKIGIATPDNRGFFVKDKARFDFLVEFLKEFFPQVQMQTGQYPDDTGRKSNLYYITFK